MTASVSNSADHYTLAHRLSEGEIPAAEALRCATAIAESLRDLHDSGKVHGWLTPSTVAFIGGRVEVFDSPAETQTAGQYTAPEVLAGDPADVRSDVYSLGAVLRAMLTGAKYFEPEASLHPAVEPAALEHFIAQCMAPDPAARPQRMQKVLLELKFLRLAARRAETQSAASLVRELSQTVNSLNQRLQSAEHEVQELRRYSAMLEEKISANFQSHEQVLQSHAQAIESAQSSSEQTDNLVERVVDALELLQSTLIDPPATPQPLSN
jgi:serine/threonine protein kinase